MIGKTISQYRILEKLGEGGMGVVFKAQDTKIDRFVALKFLPSHLTASEIDKVRFLQEAKAASAINHPNVCVIYDIREYEEEQFIIMEYVDGTTLNQKIQEGHLSNFPNSFKTSTEPNGTISIFYKLGQLVDKNFLR